jgi:hypothetical protein
MLHKYTRLYLELNALKKWTFQLYGHDELIYNRKRTQPASAADAFLDQYCASYLWSHISLNNLPSATKAEKVLYLTELGCPVKEIQEKVHMSPNKILQIQKNPPNKTHYEDNSGLNYLIEYWDNFKKVLPKEIFKKC